MVAIKALLFAGAASAAVVSQFSDGQPQATVSATAAPVSVFTDGQPQATVAATSVAPPPVSEFTDGQPQATAPAGAAPVSEFTDGQPQATVAATAMSNATFAAPKPTIQAAGASGLTASAGLFAGVAGLAALLL